MIDERNVEQFELYALEVLSKAGIKDLQAYGREKGGSHPRNYCHIYRQARTRARKQSRRTCKK